MAWSSTTPERRNRGFTLLEGLFSLLLVFMVLGAVVATLQSAVTVRQDSEASAVFAEIGHAAALIRSDIASALRVEPETLDRSRQIDLVLIDPAVPYRLRVESEEPFGEAHQVSVRYFHREGKLYRQSFTGGTTESPVPLLEVHDFRLSTEGNIIHIDFDVRSPRVEKSYRFSCARVLR